MEEKGRDTSHLSDFLPSEDWPGYISPFWQLAFDTSNLLWFWPCHNWPYGLLTFMTFDLWYNHPSDNCPSDISPLIKMTSFTCHLFDNCPFYIWPFWLLTFLNLTIESHRLLMCTSISMSLMHIAQPQYVHIRMTHCMYPLFEVKYGRLRSL